MKVLKCPSCSADIVLDDDREFGFCTYCGTKIQIGERVNVHVTHEFKGGPAQTTNNVTNNYFEFGQNAKNSVLIKKPGAGRVVFGVILLVFAIVGFPLSFENGFNGAGFVLSIMCFIGGGALLFFYALAMKKYYEIVSKAAEKGRVTNREW